jgi:hypothetical protein
MKTDYQFIRMVKMPSKGSTEIYSVVNRKYGSQLGTIKWYGPWRQYCYLTEFEDLVLSLGCLMDIGNFIKQLDDARKVPLPESIRVRQLPGDGV